MVNALKITELIVLGNITIKKFLEKTGISKQTYYNLMKSGKANVTTIEKIADFFNVPIDYFFNRNTPISCVKVYGKGHRVQSGNVNIMVEQEKEIEHLKMLLEEKERTIKILLDKNKP
ncbi:MAG: helix-turn-helix domain-containing protein [Odoribacteraceae bacterium]|jgi:transcriptional regulator with XRE-family HTH domain|nr:helix-turn-helix domain-containing protein [Odoribacteraceae bacterium]